jgi:hypothetical protein
MDEQIVAVETTPAASVTPLVDDEIDAGGKLEILGPTGHLEIKWGRKKSEVELAEATFKDLLSKGYAAFKKTWTGRKGKRAVAFEASQGVYLFDTAPVAPKAADLPPVPLPAVASAAVVPEEDEEEHTLEHTKEFEKKADMTLVPPIRGG